MYVREEVIERVEADFLHCKDKASFGAKLVFRIVSSLQKGCGKSSQHHSTSFEKKCGENQDSLMTLQNGCGVLKKVANIPKYRI